MTEIFKYRKEKQPSAAYSTFVWLDKGTKETTVMPTSLTDRQRIMV